MPQSQYNGVRNFRFPDEAKHKENMKHLFAVLSLVCQSSVWAHSIDQGYKVVEVLDGGAVRIAGQEKSFTCRLLGIVVPEKKLVFGQASRESLSALVHGRDVHVHVINTADRGALGCRLFVDGKDVSREQVKRGMAWRFVEVTIDAQMLYAENDAKTRGLGLWSDPDLKRPAQ
jgi:micrococcal nuclease